MNVSSSDLNLSQKDGIRNNNVNNIDSNENYVPSNWNDYQKIKDSVPNVKRFSIDVDHPVQQTKDLIAVHNLDEEKLLADINELGGFPAPSIAIIRQGRYMMMPNISGSIQTTKQIKNWNTLMNLCLVLWITMR
ncbi:MAG: hypothetical protein PUD05_02940 [Lachnospiraceae bacterium]|nr:hypothetical protein [Lachnospiraceae bacterium]